MKYHKCKVKHNPPDTFGDCMRACIASLLNFNDVELVPHFYRDGCDGETGAARVNQFLYGLGLKAYWIYFDGNKPIEEIVAHMAAANPDVHYILNGRTSGGDHAVVACNDQIVCDPSWAPEDLIGGNSAGLWGIMVVVPMMIVKH